MAITATKAGDEVKPPGPNLVLRDDGQVKGVVSAAEFDRTVQQVPARHDLERARNVVMGRHQVVPGAEVRGEGDIVKE